MQELVLNVHMHTFYSDGHARHADLARDAMQAGVDAIIVTDHNVWVNGFEDYYKAGRNRVLVMVGEEIHNQSRHPQKSHLLVFGARKELATFAKNPQTLIERVNQSNGLAFLAHPFEDALDMFNEGDISWEDWQVDGYTGIELWNGSSELKSSIKNKLTAIFYAYFPQYYPRGPQVRTLHKWDELLVNGKHVVAIGGSDAHASPMKMGPLRRTILPYRFHFSTINNHVLVDAPLSGDANEDSRSILSALNQGHSFVGYDLPSSTRGFRFSANATDGTYMMGDDISLKGGVTLQIRIPAKAESLLIHNGHVIKTWNGREISTFVVTEPGIYRVEVYIHYLGQRRGWIFSNPIYIR